ncbi:MAG: topoisomerase DNA-binding C4 zinc finger domain-containing protein, partial [Deltaproteobacteria bacterium]|nr:topoisomerase DNA-binding C4 zinc finger domain-containing protein [Deltaproteobacteria bacterium]
GCGSDLVGKNSRTGSRFIACTGYPNCKHAEPFSTNVPCPKCGKGMLVEKSSKRGKVFYACDQYPQCDFAIWDYPVPGECPKCKFPLLGRKNFRGRTFIGCTQKGCNYRQGGKDKDDG